MRRVSGVPALGSSERGPSACDSCSLRELLPEVGGHVVGDLERPVRPAVDRLLDADHAPPAEALAHRLLDRPVEAADLAAAPGEEDAVAEAVLELGVEARDELAEGFHDRGDD